MKCPRCGGKYNIKQGWVMEDGSLLIGNVNDPYVRCEWCGWKGKRSELIKEKEKRKLNV